MNLLKKHKKKEANDEKKLKVIQEDQLECIKLIESSFLKGLFNDTITDISFNGRDLYVQDNDLGRYKIDKKIDSDEVYDLIKKISNYMLKPFSSKNSILDVAFGDYRLTAVHPLYARSNNKKVITFSLRIIAPKLRIKEYDPILCPIEVHDLLSILVKSHQTMLISGQTGSGKTELQKYLISFVNKSDRIIIIEESYETHIKEIFPYLDVTSWLCSNESDLSDLIKLSLRYNPDWLIVAETRGIESYDMVQAAMTGHSEITTIHSESCEYSLKRITQMCKKKIDFDEKLMLKTIAEHIKIGIHMERIYDVQNQKYIRRIQEICEYIPSEDGYIASYLYKVEKDAKLKEKKVFNSLSDELLKSIINKSIDVSSIKKFIKKK